MIMLQPQLAGLFVDSHRNRNSPWTATAIARLHTAVLLGGFDWLS
jgi:hypothetical protein